MARFDILLADDDADIRLALELLLQDAGFNTRNADSPAALRHAVQEKQPDLVLLDLNFSRDTTSGREGLALLPELVAAQIPVMVLTAWGSIELAVQAVQLGAWQFLTKPWDNQQLLALVRQQQQLKQLARQHRQLSALQQTPAADWIAQSAPMQQLESLVQQVAATDANILILGENGTGKSVLARRIHQLSSRSQAPLVAVNMAAIPETLFETELFGHQKGAFTDARQARIGRFAMAEGGSLFLDEIGCLPLALQPKLLRVLENGEYEVLGSSRTEQADVRLISATNADLTTLIKQGQFRQDLLYRLNTFVLELPPLRQRPDDIAPLAEHLIKLFSQKYRKPIAKLSAGAMQQLHTYHWPGNVRELSHLLERAVLLCQQATIEDVGLPVISADVLSEQAAADNPLGTEPQELNLQRMEQRLILQALQQSEQQLGRAAELLGLSRHALARRLEKLQIHPEQL
ncbi:MAG: sigma-54 dependent transcriptional regulator [Gammaproteobacteria bacterium]|nr:sigma-54 dependent transcriptional regulator [Gammaproteobacteria bacterium]MBU2279258.1 sigma-54 dependent transcriptional regulator [Gammaproteobacteria bacterium]